MSLNWLRRVPRRRSVPTPPRFTRPRLEPLEDRRLLATFLVTNTDDSGSGSLRQAILDANADPFVDTIAFVIAGGGVQTIRPASALPAITKPVVIDGTTQPGFTGTPLIVLDGGSAGLFANGLTLTGGHSAVEGLVINNFGRSAIVLSGQGEDLVVGNYLGTDVTGTHIGGSATTSGSRSTRPTTSSAAQPPRHATSSPATARPAS
jgi:hypothetical protein